MEFLEGGTLKEATGNFQFSESHIAYVAREVCAFILSFNPYLTLSADAERNCLLT